MSLPPDIQIGIIGSGLMGTDIFYYLSGFDCRLVWICIDEEERRRLVSAFKKKYDRMFRNGLIDEEGLRRKKQRVLISTSIGDLKDCSIVIETIHEEAADKARLFDDLRPFLSNNAVVVTNTSSIQPSLLVSDEAMRKRFAGLHFFYPVKMKNIVELIVTDHTGEDTKRIVRDFTDYIDRFRLEMHEDEAFMLNRLFLDFQAQAFRCHRDDGLDVKVIDAIVRKYIFPVGVFEFFDAVGIDVMRRSIVNYTGTMADSDFYSPMIDCLDRLLGEKKLGRKSGAGFYPYPVEGPPVQMPAADVQVRTASLLRAMYINSAFKALEKNIWPQVDLEYAVKEYMAIDKGPFTLAVEIGQDAIKGLLNRYYAKTGFEAYRPSLLL
ncbi:MAG TPA: 3-hydroxyacyl-CoA dehydrogenase NAD-binding domain-containing protein [Spirochaetota bacterium]|nr:3-hydroxyacyl-CoA dehydrogenase NAD-binding domain-containing protein [Spirochaetota bacterium]HRS75640.1 3-hydroxyacyl-CoA dehydrogenase NAD-binding domain-containing protein [Spirochaetota bacterium]HRT73520.1 3-hydroxyacyl-CoA dehydrogenase NAD-binding domain-containing protein [Spirochaetota bacterium]